MTLVGGKIHLCWAMWSTLFLAKSMFLFHRYRLKAPGGYSCRNIWLSPLSLQLYPAPGSKFPPLFLFLLSNRARILNNNILHFSNDVFLDDRLKVLRAAGDKDLHWHASRSRSLGPEPLGGVLGKLLLRFSVAGVNLHSRHNVKTSSVGRQNYFQMLFKVFSKLYNVTELSFRRLQTLSQALPFPEAYSLRPRIWPLWISVI